jgi:hypothetical protein
VFLSFLFRARSIGIVVIAVAQCVSSGASASLSLSPLLGRARRHARASPHARAPPQKGSADALSPWETFSSFNSPFDIALVLLFDGMLIAWCIVFLCAHNDARKEEKRSDNHIRQGGTVGGSSETSRLLSEQESAARRRRSDAPSDEP